MEHNPHISYPSNIDPIRLGSALKEARRKRGMTQEQAATVIDVARTTITAIEKGERLIKPDELLKLVRAYGAEMNDVVRPRPEIQPFEPQFRSALELSDMEKGEADKSVEELREYCRDYLELERLTGSYIPRNYPEEYRIHGLPTETAAEMIAERERSRLGLGQGPISDLRSLLEQVGIRVFVLDMPAKISEIYVYEHELGACMAVNGKHPAVRKRFSMAHGYLHFLAHRFKPEVKFEDQFRKKPEAERLGDAFPVYFFLPTQDLLYRFSEISRDGVFRVEDLLRLADRYNVAPATLSLRLEDLRLLPTGTWDRLKDRGLRVGEMREKIGVAGRENDSVPWPRHYRLLAIMALDSEAITEGQFARFLRVDRLKARNLAEEFREDLAGVTKTDLAGTNLLEEKRRRVA